MGSDTNARYIPDEADARKNIVELCKLLYDQGFMAGTAGGMSVKDGGVIYITPSGVQKERMRANDMTMFDTEKQQYIERPDQIYKPSACVPLFKALHQHVDAGACIHTHSINAVLITLLFKEEFRISNIENIKAIPKYTEPGNLKNTDTVRIPIIDNRHHEEELEETLIETLRKNPGAPAILVRRHGVFTWGSNVWKAKVIHEALDYLFNCAIQMKQLGIDPDGEVGSEFK